MKWACLILSIIPASVLAEGQANDCNYVWIQTWAVDPSLNTFSLDTLGFSITSIDWCSVFRNFPLWYDPFFSELKLKQHKLCLGWHGSWPAAFCSKGYQCHWNGTAAESQSISCVLSCNPPVELGIAACGCACDKMATPEEVITIIYSPPTSVLSNELQVCLLCWNANVNISEYVGWSQCLFLWHHSKNSPLHLQCTRWDKKK